MQAKVIQARKHNRAYDQIRDIRVSYDVYGYALASVLYEIGGTKVLCSVSVQHNVPPFLRGKKQGWLTAEYDMLPSATHTRTQRESSSVKRNGRSVEISRFIGRSLRAVIDLTKVPDQTFIIDCDVLQADGGTRTASVTGSFLALERAIERLYPNSEDRAGIITDRLFSVSVGLQNGNVLLDIDCSEDNNIDADFNFVCTESGNLIEIQGTAEQTAVPWHLFTELSALIQKKIPLFFESIEKTNTKKNTKHVGSASPKQAKVPFFSLKNRQSAVE